MTDDRQDQSGEDDRAARKPKLTRETLKDLSPTEEEAEAAKGGATYLCSRDSTANCPSESY